MQKNKAALAIPELDLQFSLETGTSYPFVSPLFPAHRSRMEAFWNMAFVMWLYTLFEDIIAMRMNYWKRGKATMSVLLRMCINVGGQGIIVPYWVLNNIIMRLRDSQGPRCIGWPLDGHFFFLDGNYAVVAACVFIYIYIYIFVAV